MNSNIINVSKAADGLYDLDLFRIGTYRPEIRTGVPLASVLRVLLTAPRMTHIRFYDEHAERLDRIEEIHGAIERLGRTLGSELGVCPTCGGARHVDGKPCPDCAVPLPMTLRQGR